METARESAFTSNRSVSGVVLLGLVLAVSGLIFIDSMGVTLIATALGIALLVSGLSYLATDGNERLSLTNAFVSLIAVQLIAFSGVLQWIGGLLLGAVIVSIVYSRSQRVDGL